MPLDCRRQLARSLATAKLAAFADGFRAVSALAETEGFRPGANATQELAVAAHRTVGCIRSL